MQRQLKNHWPLIILLLVLWVTINALFHATLFHVHDFVHGARIAQMSLALQDGHFPVIWTKNFGLGYGMPLFEFYAPLPYYVASLVYLVGFSLVTAVKTLFIIPSLISLIGAYWLGRDLFKNKLSGLILATTFTLASYRALNLFVRGAVSESWGMMTYPWILWASWLMIQKRRKAWLWLLLALVSLFLSHNLSVLMFLPFALVWTILSWFFYQQQQSPLNLNRWSGVKSLFLREKNTILQFSLSYLLAIGLSSFYLIPAFVEKNFTQMQKIILGGYFNYRLHFLYLRQFLLDNWGYGGSTWGPNDGISFFFGWGQWLGLISLMIFLGLLIILYSRHRIQHLSRPLLDKKQLIWLRQTLVALGLAIVAILMTTEKSLFIWQKIKILRFMQFPWRYLSVATIFYTLALASLPVLLPKKIGRVLAWLIILVTLVTSGRYFQPKSFLGNSQALYYANPQRIAREMSLILPDYVPAQLNLKLKPNLNSVIVGPSWLKQSRKEKRWQVLVDKTDASLVKIKLPRRTKLVFARASYPGWQTEIDGQKVRPTQTKEGLISVIVPQGNHQVGIYLGDTPVRYWSKLISFVSIIILLALLFLPPSTKFFDHQVKSTHQAKR